jgi:hypothetical protein
MHYYQDVFLSFFKRYLLTNSKRKIVAMRSQLMKVLLIVIMSVKLLLAGSSHCKFCARYLKLRTTLALVFYYYLSCDRPCFGWECG